MTPTEIPYFQAVQQQLSGLTARNAYYADHHIYQVKIDQQQNVIVPFGLYRPGAFFIARADQIDAAYLPLVTFIE